MKQVTGNRQILTKNAVTDIDVIDGEGIERIWYRLKDEPNAAYRYFKMYLAQPQPRSMGRLAKHLRMHQSTFLQYSSRFKWSDRCAAYDDFYSQKELDRARAQRELAELNWQSRRDEQRDAEWDIAQQLLDKVRLMLNVPLFKETVVSYLTSVENEDIDADVLEKIGTDDVVIIKKVIINEPLDWSAVDITRFFEVAAKMARLATGMATEHKKLRIDVSTLTDEELERLKNE